MIYGLDKDVVYGFHIIVISVLYAFGSQCHGLLEAVSSVYFHVHAPILEWRTEIFSFHFYIPCTWHPIDIQ